MYLRLSLKTKNFKRKQSLWDFVYFRNKEQNMQHTIKELATFNKSLFRTLYADTQAGLHNHQNSNQFILSLWTTIEKKRCSESISKGKRYSTPTQSPQTVADATREKLLWPAWTILQGRLWSIKGGTQWYPQLHYWDNAFFALRIQILSFSGEFILNCKWLSDLPMKEKTLGSNPGEYNLWGYFLGYFGECGPRLPKLPWK